MNPRDSKLTRLTDVNLHRLIRRGTTYGPPYDPNALSEADDEVPRGAIFLFISAKAMATIEFLQQEWINDGNFIGIGDERDPIIGLQQEGARSPFPKIRSGDSSAASRRSTCSRRRIFLLAEHKWVELAREGGPVNSRPSTKEYACLRSICTR
jgi:deferrochelatase/peroxidase EfeB